MSGMFCSYCNKIDICSINTTLTTGPIIMILVLNRERINQFDVKFNFTEYIDLNKYIQNSNNRSNYKLIGMITHLEESDMNGNFIAYCRDPLFGLWYKYNDAIVSPVNDFQNEVVNSGIPYLLFYQLVH